MNSKLFSIILFSLMICNGCSPKLNYEKANQYKEVIFPFNEKNYKHLAKFMRKDILNINHIEKQFYKKLFKDRTSIEQVNNFNIYMERLGTKLIPYLKKPSINSGDYWLRSVLSSFKTDYMWEPQYNLDRLFQITADKLNPNITKIQDIITEPSYKLLTGHHINKLFIKKEVFKSLVCLEKLNKNGGLSEENTYALIKCNYKYLMSELQTPQKLIKWYKKKKKDRNDIEKNKMKKIHRIADKCVVVAREYSNHANTIVNNLETYLCYDYFKRDKAEDEAIKMVKNIKELLYDLLLTVIDIIIFC